MKWSSENCCSERMSLIRSAVIVWMCLFPGNHFTFLKSLTFTLATEKPENCPPSFLTGPRWTGNSWKLPILSSPGMNAPPVGCNPTAQLPPGGEKQSSRLKETKFNQCRQTTTSHATNESFLSAIEGNNNNQGGWNFCSRVMLIYRDKAFKPALLLVLTQSHDQEGGEMSRLTL